jgi:hypothetical protein
MIVIPLIGEFSATRQKYQFEPYMRVEISLPLIGAVLICWFGWSISLPYFLACDHSWFRDLIAFCCGAKKIDEGWSLVYDLGYEFPSEDALVHFCFLTGVPYKEGRKF